MSLDFLLSSQINSKLRIKISNVEGSLDRLPISETIQEPLKSLSLRGSREPIRLTAVARLFADGLPLTDAIHTASGSSAPSSKLDEWIEFPLQISQLPLTTLLTISIWGPSGSKEMEIYGNTSIMLFKQQDLTMYQGRVRLPLEIGAHSTNLPQSCPDPGMERGSEIYRLEKLLRKQQLGLIPTVDWLDNFTFRRIETINAAHIASNSNNHYLFVILPVYSHDVIFDELVSELATSESQNLSSSVSVLDLATVQQYSTHLGGHDTFKETPVEAKYRRLIRLSSDDKDLRPNARVRDELQNIINFSPLRELTSNDKNLVWKYRYYLTKQKAALTKFVQSVSWDDSSEAEMALEVINQWSPINVSSALQLLRMDVTNSQVRAYAVDRLRDASDDEIRLFVMQLVEALKFESSADKPYKSYLARFLLNRAALNTNLGNSFFWYLTVLSQEPKYGKILYGPLLKQFLKTLKTVESGTEQLNQIELQTELTRKVFDLTNLIKQSKESRPRRIAMLREFVEDPKNGLFEFSPVSLPLDPTVTVTGLLAERCSIFKSTMQPVKLTFKTTTGIPYELIIKRGDDLRQDQLIIQIIELMDKLLRDENLDLKLTPYHILATGLHDGMMQFIENETLAHILSEHHSILSYLQLKSPDQSNALGVSRGVMENYIRSCAGYAVITYLLGVGDRHLDNLLLRSDGRFFHIDFGYILGSDPKPFPPMIKLPIQLIDGMGGINSSNYNQFCSYCFTAFITLRKSASLILALFDLMSQSSLESLAQDRAKDFHLVEERFCLDLSEEEAVRHFQILINDSVSAFMPMVIDRLHSMAQYWRA